MGRCRKLLSSNHCMHFVSNHYLSILCRINYQHIINYQNNQYDLSIQREEWTDKEVLKEMRGRKEKDNFNGSDMIIVLGQCQTLCRSSRLSKITCIVQSEKSRQTVGKMPQIGFSSQQSTALCRNESSNCNHNQKAYR